jgi:hypothetical protein
VWVWLQKRKQGYSLALYLLISSFWLILLLFRGLRQDINLKRSIDPILYFKIYQSLRRLPQPTNKLKNNI